MTLLRIPAKRSAGHGVVVMMMKRRIAPTLHGLAERLDRPEARFLDVGMGVAAMCRAFPPLRIVGLDVFDAALSLARENVAAASLEDRIELRKVAVEDLRDESAFDLARLPTFLIPAVAATAEHVRSALRPGRTDW